jgi:hypothetical protein
MEPDKLDAAYLRFEGINLKLERLVYYWRVSNIHCTDDGCRKGDVVLDAIEFCEKLINDFRSQNASVEEVCEALTAAVVKLAQVPVAPPKHLWRADNACTCGWTGTEQAWVEHAGTDCLVVPWYAE